MWSDRLPKYFGNGYRLELIDNGEFYMEFVDIEPCGRYDCGMSHPQIEVFKINDEGDCELIDSIRFYYDDDFTDNFNKICDDFFEKYIKE